MRKYLIFIITMALISSFSSSSYAQAEREVTLSTYYPAPFGDYDELNANSITVGHTTTRSAPAYMDSPSIYAHCLGGGTNPEGSIAVHRALNGGNISARLDLHTHRGTFDNPAVSQTGDFLGEIRFNALQDKVNVADDWHPAAMIRSVVNEAPAGAGGSTAADLLFMTSDHTYWPGERMRIKSNGNVGIGTSAPLAPLDVTCFAPIVNGSPLTQDVYFRVGGLPNDNTINGIDSGRVWIEYGQQAAPLLVLEDYDNPPRIQFQQTGADLGSGAGTEAVPNHASWIGHSTMESSDISIMNGNVGIGTSAPQSILDVSSTSSAFMPPRMTSTERDLISPPREGMVIYNTTTDSLNTHNGSNWNTVGAGPTTIFKLKSPGQNAFAGMPAMDPVLQFDIQPGEKWQYDLVATFGVKNATIDVELAFDINPPGIGIVLNGYAKMMYGNPSSRAEAAPYHSPNYMMVTDAGLGYLHTGDIAHTQWDVGTAVPVTVVSSGIIDYYNASGATRTFGLKWRQEAGLGDFNRIVNIRDHSYLKATQLE
ncbi:hypothetical protein ACFL0T_05220 [Candidatus Omnitrophota bacterium]